MSEEQKSYSGKFKKKVVEDMLKNMGYNETTKKYGCFKDGYSVGNEYIPKMV